VAVAATLGEPGLMKKKSRGRPKTDRDEVTVKCDRIVANKVKSVALHRGLTVGELVTEFLRSQADRAYAQMLRELEGRK
jgi:hypothetical protein